MSEAGKTFVDLFNLNLASVTEAVDRHHREALLCAEGVVEDVLEMALDRVGLGTKVRDMQVIVEELLQNMLAGGNDSVPRQSLTAAARQQDKVDSPSSRDESESDDENVVIINVDSVVREEARAVGSAAGQNETSEHNGLTGPSLLQKEVQSQRTGDVGNNSPDGGNDRSLLDSALNIEELAGVDENGQVGASERIVTARIKLKSSLEEATEVPNQSPITSAEVVDLTCDSDSRDSDGVITISEGTNELGSGPQQELTDDASVDPLDICEPELIEPPDRPSLRQVATVHPLPSTRNSSSHCEESVAVFVEEQQPVAVPTPPRTVLRLRNFAVDPANQLQHQPQPGMQAASSWHMVEGAGGTTTTAAVSAQSEKVTDFASPTGVMKIRCIIGIKEGQESKYAVVSSNRNIFLKLFFHDSQVAAMPATDEGWKDVSYSFSPVGSRLPTDIRLTFRRFFDTVVEAKLPTTDTEVSDLIEQRATFVLSMVRIKKLDDELRNKLCQPFVKFAVRDNQELPEVVKITENALVLEPLYSHLQAATTPTILTPELRSKTREHLTAASRYFKLNERVTDLESSMFSKSGGNVARYRSLIPRALTAPPSNGQRMSGNFVERPQSAASRVLSGNRTLLNISLSAASNHPANKSPAITVLPVVPRQQTPPVVQQQATPVFYISHPPLTQQTSSAATAGSTQPSCPFCCIPFLSIRSEIFYRHIAIFHFPPLSESQSCDVANCNSIFTTRTEHVKHVSDHTVGNDTYFINGLQKLLDYLSDAQIKKDVLGPNDSRWNKSTVCPMCKTVSKNLTDFFHHLTFSHFYQDIVSNISAESGVRCLFSKCNDYLDSVQSQVTHLGVQHQVSYRLLRLRSREGSSGNPPGTAIGANSQTPEKLMDCPLLKCPTGNMRGIPNVILHLLTHFSTPLKFEVQKLQKILGLDEGVCPVEGCNFTMTRRNSAPGNSDGLIAALVEHYGIAHVAIIDSLFRNSAEENLLKLDVNIKDYEDYRCNVVKAPAFTCGICADIQKNVRYGSNRALLLHLTMAHYCRQLHTMFSASYESRGGEVVGNCKNCNIALSVGDRALHVGVVHKRANDFLIEYMQKKSTEQQQQVPLEMPRNCPLPSGGRGNSAREEVITIADDTPPSTSTPPAATERIDCFYDCPRCPAKFPLTSPDLKESEKAAEKLLCDHLVRQHFANELEAKLNPILPYCPVGQCPLRTQDMTVMVGHVGHIHHIYISAFLQSQLRVPTLAKFLVDERKSPEPENVETKDPADLELLYKEYENFCKERYLRVERCDASHFSVFLNCSSVIRKAESFEVVDKFLKKVSSMHDHPLTTTPLISKTLNTLRSKMSAAASPKPKDPVGDLTDDELKRAWVCTKCNRSFLVLQDLINHVSSPTHIGALVGCRYCKFFIKVENKVDSRRTMLRTFQLHGYGKNHLYNRRLFLQRARNQTVRPTDLALTNFCEPCFERVEDLIGHVEKKGHQQKMNVINDFVDYCDKREICPVTCSVKDVNFHMEICKHKNISIYQILLIISRLHDPVDGVELCGTTLVEEKMKELNDSKSREPFHMICYSCLFGASSVEEMQTHVKSVPHKVVCRSKANNLVICELCTMVFKNTANLSTHIYSPEHLLNVGHLKLGKVLVPCMKGETFCSVCGVDDKPTGNHTKSESHLQNCEIANVYLSYCKEKSLDPISCRASNLSAFFHDIYGKKSSPPSDIDLAFEVVQRLHTGNSIMEDSFLIRSVDNLKKVHTLPHLHPVVSAASDSAEEKKNEVMTPKKASSEHVYLGSLDSKEVDKVTRCAICYLSFSHATYLLLHMLHIHSKDPTIFVKKEVKSSKKKQLTCHKCIGKCTSPLIFALHYDRHQVDKYIHCTVCDRKYYTPNSHYMTDSCRKNSIPASVKTRVDQVITKAVSKSKGVIGLMLSENGISSDSEEDDVVKTGGVKTKHKGDSDEEADQEYVPPQESDEDAESSDDEEPKREDRSVTAMLKRYPQLSSNFPKVAISRKDKRLADKSLVDRVSKDTPTRKRSAAEAPSSATQPPQKKRTRSTADDKNVSSSALGPMSSKNETFADRRPGPASAAIRASGNKVPLQVREPGPSKVLKAAPVANKSGGAPTSLKSKPTASSSPAVAARNTGRPVKPLASRMKCKKSLYFCLDCEGCPGGATCDHTGHPRVPVGDYEASTAHTAATNHKQFQPASTFLQLKKKVLLSDLAYDKRFGNKVRKQFKKLCLAGTIDCRNYEKEKKCRKCNFVTDQVVEMFRHLREVHLKGEGSD